MEVDEEIEDHVMVEVQRMSTDEIQVTLQNISLT